MLVDGRYQRSPAAHLAHVPKRSLQEFLAEGPLTVEDALQVAARILGELGGIHQRGDLHGGVRPANIILRQQGSIADAKLRPVARLIDGRPAQLELQASADARYLSPEQSGLVDAPVDGRSDIYSLGAVLHECLTGRPLFDGETVRDILRRHLSLEVSGLPLRGLRVPRALEDVVIRMLAKHPARRYQSTGATLLDIEAIADALSRGDPAGRGRAARPAHRAGRAGVRGPPRGARRT